MAAQKQYSDGKTNEQWLADYYEENPIYDQSTYVRAIVLAVEKAASEHNIEVDIDDDKVLSSMGSNKSGVAVGTGSATNKKLATVKMYNNGVGNYTVKRGDQEIDSFSATKFGASFKSFKANGGETIRLDIGGQLKEAARQVLTKVSASPELVAEQKARMEEQMKFDALKQGYQDQADAVTNEIKQASQALFKFEHQALKNNAIYADHKPSDLNYPKRKHTGLTKDQLDSAYSNALPTPENFTFLSQLPVDDDPRIKDLQHSPIAKSAMEVEIRKEQLATVMANLKRVDFEVSDDDEPHPLITAYEEKYGEIRSLTAQEEQRIEYIKGKTPFGDNIFVGAIRVEDITNPDAEIVTGQLFTAQHKKNLQNLSISNAVNIVGGDVTKPIDGFALAEGIATATSLKELLDHDPEYKGKNMVVLSSFDVGNFKKIGEYLHENFPDTPVMAVADNDVQIRVTSGNRPILAADGGYSYITRDGGTVSGTDLPTNLKKQKEILAMNAGADAARHLNQYFLDNPNMDAEGNPKKPMASAFVANKGDKISDYLYVPASPNKDGKTPLEDRLKSPKGDVNDFLEIQKAVLRHDLNNEWKAMEVKPTAQEKMAIATKAMQDMATTLISQPATKLKQAMDKIFDKRLADGRYDNIQQERMENVIAPVAAPTASQQKDLAQVATLQASLKEHLEELFDIEHSQLHGLNVDRTPSQMAFVKERSPNLVGKNLNDFYNRTLAMPDKFDFLAFDKNEQVTPDVLEKRLETVVSNIRQHDAENELVEAFVKDKGYEPRALTEAEIERVESIQIDRSEAANTISGKKVFMPSHTLNGISSNNGASVAGGRVYEGDTSHDIEGMSITNQVGLVDGDPSEKIDFMYITDNIESGATLAAMQRATKGSGDPYSNIVVLNAFDAANAQELAKTLNKMDVDYGVNFVLSNDQDVKLDANKKPVLTDGDYTYIGRDGQDITAKDIDASALEQEHQVNKNAGAAAAKAINTHIAEHQTLRPSEHLHSIRMAAIVINKGVTITDHLIKPQEPDLTGQRPKDSVEGLLSPSVSLQSLADGFTALKQQDLVNRKPPAEDERAPQISRAKIGSYLLRELINKPLGNAKDALTAIVRQRKDDGYYEPAQVKQREVLELAAKKHEDSVKTSTSNTKDGFNANIKNTDNGYTKSGNKYDKAINESSDLARRIASNHINDDILKSFDAPAPKREEPSVKAQPKPQQEATNMPRPSPR